MRRRKPALLILALVALAALAVAPDALAAAGGGSSSFGGGGGGGGGGGRGGGAGVFIIFELLFRFALLGHGLGALVIVAVVILYFVYVRGVSFWRAHERRGPAARKKTAQRSRRVELAAAEAAEDDEAFAPDIVKAQATALFKEVQKAWDADDRIKLRGLVGRELLNEWERRLDDYRSKGWHNRVEVVGEPDVEYIGLKNRDGSGDDRVTVRIEARVKDYVVDRYGRRLKREGSMTETTKLREFWTLRKRDGHWILQSIEQGAEGSHALDDDLVATAWSDDQGLQDEALTELAAKNALPDDVKPAEVADLDFEGDARAAALDLSLQDARFAPDILEVAARRVTQAWMEAIDGNDAGLSKLASRTAALDLLHPGDASGKTRLVVRGLKLNSIRIAALDAAAEPPTMAIEVTLHGARYVEDRDTAAVVSGNPSRQTTFTEYWTLALAGDDAQPWRIVAVGKPLARA
jgi:predicted lipid-binding transport protein (Tim44 family)